METMTLEERNRRTAAVGAASELIDGGGASVWEVAEALGTDAEAAAWALADEHGMDMRVVHRALCERAELALDREDCPEQHVPTMHTWARLLPERRLEAPDGRVIPEGRGTDLVEAAWTLPLPTSSRTLIAEATRPELLITELVDAMEAERLAAATEEDLGSEVGQARYQLRITCTHVAFAVWASARGPLPAASDFAREGSRHLTLAARQSVEVIQRASGLRFDTGLLGSVALRERRAAQRRVCRMLGLVWPVSLPPAEVRG